MNLIQMEDTDSSQKLCLNCGATLNGEFCSSCGQSASVHRVTFRETIDDFFSSTFALQGPLLSTIKLLILNPGKLFREFIEGKRKSYYKPVAFFVVLTAIYLILRAMIGYNPLEGEMSGINETSAETLRRSQRAAFFMVANINNIMMFLVFSIGLNQKLFFWKKYNLAEYTVVGFYIVGIYTLVGMLQMLIEVYLFTLHRMTIMGFLFLYLLYTSWSLHRKKTFLSITKYVFISLFSIILYVVFGFGFSYLMVG